MKETTPPLRSPPQSAIAAAVTNEMARQAAGLWGGASARILLRARLEAGGPIAEIGDAG